jgi:hypothetical protein
MNDLEKLDKIEKILFDNGFYIFGPYVRNKINNIRCLSDISCINNYNTTNYEFNNGIGKLLLLLCSYFQVKIKTATNENIYLDVDSFITINVYKTLPMPSIDVDLLTYTYGNKIKIDSAKINILNVFDRIKNKEFFVFKHVDNEELKKVIKENEDMGWTAINPKTKEDLEIFKKID